MSIPFLEPTPGFRHTKKLLVLLLYWLCVSLSKNTCYDTDNEHGCENEQSQREEVIPECKLLTLSIRKAVPVLFSTFVNEVDRTDLVIDGMELSMLATTTSPTIIVTAAITTVRMRETMSIPPSAFLNIFHLHLHWLMIYILSIYKGY